MAFDWSSFVPDLLATFVGVVLALLADGLIERVRDRKTESAKRAEWASLRGQLVKDVVRNGIAAEGMFGMELYGNIADGERDLNYTNVTFSSTLWGAIGARYCNAAGDMMEVERFAAFYRLLDDTTLLYLSPGDSSAERHSSAFRRSLVIQSAVRVGRDIVEAYGEPADREAYPKPEAMTPLVEQARAEKAKRTSIKP